MNMAAAQIGLRTALTLEGPCDHAPLWDLPYHDPAQIGPLFQVARPHAFVVGTSNYTGLAMPHAIAWQATHHPNRTSHRSPPTIGHIYLFYGHQPALSWQDCAGLSKTASLPALGDLRVSIASPFPGVR